MVNFMVEKVIYEVLKKIDDVEIRKYPKIILAVVEGFEGDSGFSLLFNYFYNSSNINKRNILRMFLLFGYFYEVFPFFLIDSKRPFFLHSLQI